MGSGDPGTTGPGIFGIRLLEVLKTHRPDIERHLILSTWAEATIKHETNYTTQAVRDLSTTTHSPKNMASALVSGSFLTDGMVVVPCSMKTLAAIRHGLGDNLLARAANVTIKERRRLILVTRESPLSAIHLENMLELARLGITIFPPVPAFYARPHTLSEAVDYTVVRILDQLGVHIPWTVRWGEPRIQPPDLS
ncbi:MAG: phenolic acid decarboxylase [Sulfobacillus benefaciens]|uniref:Flavin prenyltransferase UbiX n=1 Tax=Sulfobacillus benefaciens TaxID=453960 RepID=A0A2T2XD46_9FIRM|nr:MAG: phenolic acid decarboxylase [Sulfobacillus benefaciens]